MAWTLRVDINVLLTSHETLDFRLVTKLLSHSISSFVIWGM